MAFLPNDWNEDEEQGAGGQQQQVQQGGAPGGTLSAGGNSGSEQKKGPASTGFINFQTYLDANKEGVGQAQDQLINTARQGRDQARTQIDTIRDSSIRGVEDAGKDTFGMKDDDPLTKPWQSEARGVYESVNSINPEWSSAVENWRTASQSAQNLGNRQGQASALKQYFDRPGYTSGEFALDSALVSADNDKFADLASETQGLGDVVGDARNAFSSVKQKYQDIWNPDKFEAKPDAGVFNYDQKLVDQAGGESTLGRAEIDQLLGSQSKLQEAIGSGQYGAKATNYLQSYLDKVAPVADEQDYRSDLAQGQGYGDQASGYFDQVGEGGYLGQEDFGKFQQAQSGFSDYLGGGDVNDRADQELQQLEQRFQQTLQQNTQNQINAALGDAGFSVYGVQAFADRANQGLEPQGFALQFHKNQLPKLQAAIQANSWNPEAVQQLQAQFDTISGAIGKYEQNIAQRQAQEQAAFEQMMAESHVLDKPASEAGFSTAGLQPGTVIRNPDGSYVGTVNEWSTPPQDITLEKPGAEFGYNTQGLPPGSVIRDPDGTIIYQAPFDLGLA